MIKDYEGINPTIDDSVFIAESADVIGDVTLGKNVSIWYNAVLRGDADKIVIGDNTNIQDGTVVHTGYSVPTIVGKNVTVGHNVILHGCIIEDNCLIGMGSIVLDNAEIGEGSMVGAGSLVTGKKFPPGVLILGSPAKVIRELTDKEKESLALSPKHYIETAQKHK